MVYLIRLPESDMGNQCCTQNWDTTIDVSNVYLSETMYNFIWDYGFRLKMQFQAWLRRFCKPYSKKWGLIFGRPYQLNTMIIYLGTTLDINSVTCASLKFKYALLCFSLPNIKFNFWFCANFGKKTLCWLIFTDKKVSKILQRQTLTYYSKIRKICKSCFMQKLVSGKFNLVKTYTQNVQKMKNVNKFWTIAIIRIETYSEVISSKSTLSSF